MGIKRTGATEAKEPSEVVEPEVVEEPKKKKKKVNTETGLQKVAKKEVAVEPEISEEAQEEKAQIIKTINKFGETLKKRGVEILRINFGIGAALKPIINNPKKYGKNALNEVAKEVGAAASTLYLCHDLARKLHYKEESLDRWIERKQGEGLTATFALARKELIQPEKNPAALGGEENMLEALKAKAEKIAGEIQTALGTAPDDVGLQGVSALIEEELAAVAFAVDGARGKTQKTSRFRSPLYLAWLHKQPCIVTGEMGVQAHHVISKATGNAASDMFAVPLTAELHKQYHELAMEDFQKETGVNFADEIQKLHQKFAMDMEHTLKANDIQLS